MKKLACVLVSLIGFIVFLRDDTEQIKEDMVVFCDKQMRDIGMLPLKDFGALLWYPDKSDGKRL